MSDETTDKPAGTDDTAPGTDAAATPDSAGAAASAAPQQPATTAASPILNPPVSNQSSGSVTRAIARQMLAQEKDTRTFGRRGAVMAGTLIVLSSLVPVLAALLLSSGSALPNVAKDLNGWWFNNARGPLTLPLLLGAGIVSVLLAFRAEGVRRAKGLFWAGIIAFLALLAGRPADIGVSVTTIFGLLAWSGMLIAARLRLTFEQCRTAQAMGAISAGPPRPGTGSPSRSCSCSWQPPTACS